MLPTVQGDILVYREGNYEAGEMAQGVGIELATFLFPLLVILDDLLDKRLMRTFLSAIQLIITL